MDIINLKKETYYKLNQDKELYVYEIVKKYGVQFILGRIKNLKSGECEYNLFRYLDRKLEIIETKEELYDVASEFLKKIPNTEDCKEFLDNIMEY
ncbi:MAG: hypothetical protein VZS44_05045 [Bacilli bacterium]|nr:hypothetical protein [Bacilli bacterium]